MTLAIRAIAPGEHAALGAITVAAYRALGYVEAAYERELADVDAKVAAGAEVVVAVDGNGVVGGVAFVPDHTNALAEFDDPDAASFRHLAVDPTRQGSGAGSALARWCIERARALGRKRVVIHSTPWMTTAHGLYERLGFVRVPELDWLPVPEVPLLGFVKEL